MIPSASDLEGRRLTVAPEFRERNPRRPHTHGWLAFEVLRRAPQGSLQFDEYARRLFQPEPAIAELAKSIPGQPNAYQDFRHIRCDLYRGAAEADPPLPPAWYEVARCSPGPSPHRSVSPQSKLSITEFRRRVNALDGARLQTGTGKRTFAIRVTSGGLEYIPDASGKPRPDSWQSIERVLARHNHTGSFRPADYQDITHHSSYVMAILRRLHPDADGLVEGGGVADELEIGVEPIRPENERGPSRDPDQLRGIDPDEIKELVDREYPRLVSKRRNNPDGWAFYVRGVDGTSKSSRIARVVRRRPGSPVMFKPAVSARLTGNRKLEMRIAGGPDQVRGLMDAELALWDDHFGRQVKRARGGAAFDDPDWRPPKVPAPYVDETWSDVPSPRTRAPEQPWIRRAELIVGAVAFVLVAYLLLTMLL